MKGDYYMHPIFLCIPMIICIILAHVFEDTSEVSVPAWLVALIIAIISLIGSIGLTNTNYVITNDVIDTVELIPINDDAGIYCEWLFLMDEQETYLRYKSQLGTGGVVIGQLPVSETMVIQDNDIRKPRIEVRKQYKKFWFFKETSTINLVFVPTDGIDNTYFIEYNSYNARNCN